MNTAPIHQVPSSPAQDLPRPFVLVVDDERRIAETLALILGSRGYAAAAADDGASALEICRQKAPDLVITDVVMPDMNGIDLAITIRQRYPDCHILLFSGQAETADILEDARQRGYDFELLAKPLHPEELLARIKVLIGPPAGPAIGATLREPHLSRHPAPAKHGERSPQKEEVRNSLDGCAGTQIRKSDRQC